jgi:archaellum component FlaC
MFVHVINDLFRNLILDKNTDNFFDNGDKIIKYSNEQIERINKRYKSKETKYFIRV